ncbi:MAG: tetratricopeptide repeat protein [Campylobacteraceae bacterium]|nr:tetratricopeptide repeat protein [Campylobacteraceae bacterium]
MNLQVTLGIDNFYKRDYDGALFNFSLALQENPECKEAKLGAILADMAKQRESEAQALFEYYLLLNEDENKQSEDIVQDIIELIDNSTESIYKLIESKELEFAINEENGIEYEDFIELIKQRGSFKKAFEDIMFSTKVMISNKDDFIDFLEKLIENDFTEMSLNYLESAITIFPNDIKLLSLAKKAKKI